MLNFIIKEGYLDREKEVVRQEALNILCGQNQEIQIRQDEIDQSVNINPEKKDVE